MELPENSLIALKVTTCSVGEYVDGQQNFGDFSLVYDLTGSIYKLLYSDLVGEKAPENLRRSPEISG